MMWCFIVVNHARFTEFPIEMFKTWKTPFIKSIARKSFEMIFYVSIQEDPLVKWYLKKINKFEI